ncbi:unnamed protein product [marine sediment metagenome]|uniref:Uncharacterized protein n=1 Tax=marine sediment metagenome TaxID=412755 RepID=X0ZTP1_9ZZZZ
MPCDLETQRRRIKWEYLNSQNAPCLSEWGFSLSGSQAKEYWCEFDVAQSDPLWTWMDGGHLLSRINPPILDATGELEFRTGIGGGEIATLKLEGFNEIQEGEFAGFTVAATFLFNFVPPATPGNVLFEDTRVVLAPQNNLQWPFPNLVQTFPNPDVQPFPRPTGILRVTPLKACHTCIG